MNDFRELMSNQVFNEDFNDFEDRSTEFRKDSPQSFPEAEVLANGDVLFRLYAPSASSVVIDFKGTHIRTQKGTVIPMEKNDDGIWQFLLPYSPTDVGPRDFSFIIDGAELISPHLPVYHRCGRNNNYIEIPDPDFTAHHIKDVPHGSVCFRTYWSQVYDRWMRLVVYLPANYNHTSDNYPVVYLNNGGSENETTWFNASKVHYIMDNLIASGQAKPMIIVTTNTMAFRNEEEAKDELLFGWKEMVLKDTIPFIESEYRVYKDKWNRAICGDSFGGVAAGFMGWDHPELFGNIGFFAAPIRYDNIWKSFEENSHMHWMIGNGEEVNRQYKIIFMSRGEAEYLTNWTLQKDDDWLSLNGIMKQDCMHVRLYGGDFTHDHSTFRRGFADFVKLLFKNEERHLGFHKHDNRLETGERTLTKIPSAKGADLPDEAADTVKENPDGTID